MRQNTTWPTSSSPNPSCQSCRQRRQPTFDQPCTILLRSLSNSSSNRDQALHFASTSPTARYAHSYLAVLSLVRGFIHSFNSLIHSFIHSLFHSLVANLAEVWLVSPWLSHSIWSQFDPPQPSKTSNTPGGSRRSGDSSSSSSMLKIQLLTPRQASQKLERRSLGSCIAIVIEHCELLMHKTDSDELQDSDPTTLQPQQRLAFGTSDWIGEAIDLLNSALTNSSSHSRVILLGLSSANPALLAGSQVVPERFARLLHLFGVTSSERQLFVQHGCPIETAPSSSSSATSNRFFWLNHARLPLDTELCIDDSTRRLYAAFWATMLFLMSSIEKEVRRCLAKLPRVPSYFLPPYPPHADLLQLRHEYWYRQWLKVCSTHAHENALDSLDDRLTL